MCLLLCFLQKKRKSIKNNNAKGVIRIHFIAKWQGKEEKRQHW